MSYNRSLFTKVYIKTKQKSKNKPLRYTSYPQSSDSCSCHLCQTSPKTVTFRPINGRHTCSCLPFSSSESSYTTYSDCDLSCVTTSSCTSSSSSSSSSSCKDSSIKCKTEKKKGKCSSDSSSSDESSKNESTVVNLCRPMPLDYSSSESTSILEQRSKKVEEKLRYFNEELIEQYECIKKKGPSKKLVIRGEKSCEPKKKKKKEKVIVSESSSNDMLEIKDDQEEEITDGAWDSSYIYLIRSDSSSSSSIKSNKADEGKQRINTLRELLY